MLWVESPRVPRRLGPPALLGARRAVRVLSSGEHVKRRKQRPIYILANSAGNNPNRFLQIVPLQRIRAESSDSCSSRSGPDPLHCFLVGCHQGAVPDTLTRPRRGPYIPSSLISPRQASPHQKGNTLLTGSKIETGKRKHARTPAPL